MLVLALVMVAIGIAAAAFVVIRSRQRSATAKVPPAHVAASVLENILDPQNLFLSTSGQGDERAAKVLPGGPSENARHVLGDPPRPQGRPSGDEADEDHRDYAPNPQVEWVVDVVFPEGTTLRRDRILGAFGREWRTAQGLPTIYGFSPQTSHWTYVDAADVPDVYSRLQVAWRYVPLDSGDAFSTATATRWLEATTAAAASLGPQAVRPAVPVESAERRAATLRSLEADLRDAEQVTVAVVAPEGRPFEGRALWDALESLGLRWRDMDEFHWLDTDDNPVFSVWTSTEPGYFFPEEAVAGRLRVEDLIFSFSVPRTSDPLAVLAAMLRAAKYVEGRLGGRLEGDETTLAASVRQTIERMNGADITPGSDAALQLF